MEEEKVKKTIAEVEELKKELDSLLPMASKDEGRLWQKLLLEWNYNSNHLEGNTLTLGETYLLLFKDLVMGTHELREVEEMKAHHAAILLVKEWAAEKGRQLTEADIRDLNKLILVRPFRKKAVTPEGVQTSRLIVPGEYKKYPNHVLLPGGGIFEYAMPEEVPALMNDLLNWYNNEAGQFHPLVAASVLHYRLVRIHPFDDGNGRVARLLMNYHLLREGYPPVIIKSEDKAAYLAALGSADAGDIETFINYIGKQLVGSLQLAVKAARGEKIEEPKDWKKRLELLKRNAKSTGNKAVPKTPELVEARLKDSIIPLFKALDAALSEFDDLFLSKVSGWKTDTPLLVNSEEEFLKKCKETNPNLVRYLSEFTGYKYNGISPFDMSVYVRVDLKEYYYNAFLDNTTIRIPAKSYSESLTSEEIESFVDQVAKYFTDYIQKNTTTA